MKYRSDLPDHIVLRSEKGFEDWSLDDIVSEYEKRVLGSMIKKGASLEEKNGLAETLKISRATLYRKLKEYHLEK
jgi:transcriptional regulator with PAS, ATPase and Fis domain